MDDVSGRFDNTALDTSNTTERTLADVIYDRIVKLTEYRKRDLVRPIGMNARDFSLSIHAAEQRLLEQGIVFQPVRGGGGLRRRADSAKQAEARSGRFASAAARKMERATLLVEAARGLTDDPMEKQRLERLELRRRNAEVDAAARLRGAGEKRPRGI